MDLTKFFPPGARSFIERHPKVRRAFKSFGYLFSERLVKIAVGFFVHALLARHLGPVHFGKLSYIVKTVTVFFTFGLFGVDEIVIRELMYRKHPEEDILKTVLILRLRMSLVGIICLGFFLVIFQPEGWVFTTITFLYGINIVFQAFNIYELKFHALMDFRPLFWANNISYISSSILRVLGVMLNGTVTFFLATYIWGEIVLKALVLRQVGFHAALKGTYLDDFAKKLKTESMPYFLSAFVMLLDQRLSFIFLEKYRSLTELGNYSVAVTLIDLWLFLPTAIAAAVFPTIVTAFNGKLPQYKTRVQYLSDIMVWTALVFSGGVFFSADFVIRLLYGDRYLQAPEALTLYALTTIPVFFNLARIKWMTLEDHLKEWLWINVICLGINLVGHIAFVPSLGIKGAIGSYLGSQLLGNLLASIFFPASRKSTALFFQTFTFPIRVLSKLR